MSVSRNFLSITRSVRHQVAVVGLLDGQAARVRQALGDRLDVRFLPATRRPGIPVGCDCVVLVTKFIDHAWQTAAYRSLPRHAVHRHHGGIKELLALLACLANRGVAGRTA